MTAKPSPAFFEAFAQNLLEGLFDQLMDRCDDICDDITLESGILTVHVNDKQIFVISRHSPTQQIWLSSPLTGAWHFQPHLTETMWQLVATKNSTVFFPDLLASELSSLLNQQIELDIHVS